MADELARERPDVLVADYFLLGAIAAAERAADPTAVLVHNALVAALTSPATDCRQTSDTSVRRSTKPGPRRGNHPGRPTTGGHWCWSV
jgi:hypothetical protein